MKKYRERNREKIREINKKSESRPERKEYIKDWWKNNPKAKKIRSKFAKSEKGKKYQRDWHKENPVKAKLKYKRYYNSVKGIINRLKKIDKARFGICNNNLTIELIEMVNSRDKQCPYCKKEFVDIRNFKEIQYDHINPFLPFSKTNIVRCCDICNQEKGNANVFEWCEFNGYKPALIIYELVKSEKQKNEKI